MSSALYFSKTISVFCLAETINVICSLLFKDYHSLFVLQRESRSSASLHLKTIRVFCQDYHNHFYISKTSMSFVKTIIVFFTFQRLQCLLSRLSQSSLHFKDFNVFCQDYHSLLYVSKTIRVFCQDYHSLLYFSKTIKVCCLAGRLSKSYALYIFKDHQSLLF